MVESSHRLAPQREFLDDVSENQFGARILMTSIVRRGWLLLRLILNRHEAAPSELPLDGPKYAP